VAELLVDLDGIRQNTAAVVTLLRERGLRLVAVTKGCLGDARVAQAMLDGGAAALADTRDANLRRLRAAHPGAELHRIYLPPLSAGFESGDVAYVSSVDGARAVAARVVAGERRRVLLMLETGDYREGVTEQGLESLAHAVAGDPRLELAGIATNYACFQGEPDGLRGSVEAVAAAARRLRALGWDTPSVSAGNSSVLALVRAGERLPPEVTELRCGEALLLGQDALLYQRLPGCRQDACRLRVEVLEGYTKPARGPAVRRLVLGVGRQDVASGAVRFVEPGLHDLGRSSDYLVAGVDAGGPDMGPGDLVEMVPGYTALVAAWTSPFVEVRFV
jgi:ornithine racemase